MKELNQSLQTGELHYLYLLYGDEDYLKNYYKKSLEKVTFPEGNSMNTHYFEGKDIEQEVLRNAILTLPFLSPYRLVIIENSEFFQKSSEAILQIIEDKPETTRLIFIEEKVDKRNKLYKFFQKNGKVVELSYQSEEMILRWVVKRLGDEGIKIKKDGIAELIFRAGPSLKQIEQEVEKLIAYCIDKKIVQKIDVQTLVPLKIENKIFDMIGDLCSRRIGQTIAKYRDLLQLKEPPIRILSLVSKQFKQMRLIKEMEKDQKSSIEMQEVLGLATWQIKKLQGMSRRFSLSQLQEILEKGIDLDVAIKTGKIAEDLGLELLFYEINDY